MAMRGSSLFCIGLLVLAICTAPTSGSAQQRRNRGGGNEIYLPDRDAVPFNCKNQCETFREACVEYCEEEGRIPASSDTSDDCAKDCKKMEADCLTTCSKSMSFSKPPPAMRR